MRAGRGAALPAAMMAVLGFAIMIAGTYALLRLQVRETLYGIRLAQAQAIAEAGLEDAMFTVMQTPAWKTGYTNKPFAGGSYTVSISTDSQPWITSTGYSLPIPIIGPAARTVKAQMVFNGFYNFSDSTFSAAGAVTAYDSVVDRIPTCKTTALNASGCQYGSHVLANTAMILTGGAGLFNGNAMYATATSTPPSASSVLSPGTVSLAPAPLVVPIVDGSAFLTQNDNNAAHISPFTAYSTTTMILTVASGNVTLSSGTYYFKGINVTSKTLNISLGDATQTIQIYLAGNLYVSPLGAIDSSQSCTAASGNCRAYNTHIYGQGGGNLTIGGYSAVNKSANTTYLDLYCPKDDITINQRMLGRVVGKSVKLLNPYTGSPSYPLFLFDVQFGIAPNGGVHWVQGSWSESYWKP